MQNWKRFIWVDNLKINNFHRGRFFPLALMIAFFITLPGCTTFPDFEVKNFAKTNIDEMSDIHLDQVTQLLITLTEKLYKKNPSELRKEPGQNIATRIETIFKCPAYRLHDEVDYKMGTDAILLGFEPAFKGDRVFAVMYGLYTMILKSYNDQCEMFFWDNLNQQSLYNSARNIEILVWRLKERRQPDGKLYLLTNSVDGQVKNLSFERIFGKLISLQDTIALIVSGRTSRVVKKAVHFVGLAFLPVGL